MMTSTTPTKAQVGEQRQETNIRPNNNNVNEDDNKQHHSTTTTIATTTLNENNNSMLYIDFDNLCDDIVERILLHVDLVSLLNFTNGTCHSLRHRFTMTTGSNSNNINSRITTITTNSTEGTAALSLWRTVFERHNFAPPLPIITIDYQQELQYRLALWNNLCGTTKKKKKKKKFRKMMEEQCRKSSSSLSLSSSEVGTTRRSQQQQQQQQQQYCFSLPTSSFKFKPLLPPNMLQYPPPDVDYTDDGNNYDTNIMDDDIDTTTTTATMDVLPTVEFACNSYALTSPSIGPGYVFLCPYSGSITIYANILDNIICSDETLLGQTLLNEMRKADDFIRTTTTEEVERRSSSSSIRYDTPPIQTLFSVDDYFNMNLEEYFGQYTPFGSSTFSHLEHNNYNSSILQNGEANVDWLGVDTHISLSDDGGSTNNNSIVRKMVGAARTVTMESSTNQRTTHHHHHHHHMVRNNAPPGGGFEPIVTEILAWSDDDNNNNNDGDNMTYDIKYVCRVAGEAYFMDICATNCKLYAVFHKTSGFCPILMRHGDTSNHAASRQQHQMMDIDDDIEIVANNDVESMWSKTIYCLPLIRMHNHVTTPVKQPQTIASYFPMPDASITAQYAVSSFAVDSTGKTLVIGTTCGTVEVWHTGMSTTSATPAPARIQIRSIHESFVMRHRAMTMDAATRKCVNRKCVGEQKNSTTTTTKSNDGTETTLDDLAVLLDSSSSSTTSSLLHHEFPHKHPTSQIMQFYIPRHLPMHRCGFVTRQKSPQYGTTLLLWQQPRTSSSSISRCDDTITAADDTFHITAMINLPLAVQCHPAIHYDGRRLIVFGMDHIGLIILVYHVLGTRYDLNEFNDTTTSSSFCSASSGRGGGEESGGVVQLNSERTVRFVNRIRHAGLGGLEYFDSMLMTVNERFIIVNTKTGNLIGSGVGAAQNATDGLLVIDLLEQSH